MQTPSVGRRMWLLASAVLCDQVGFVKLSEQPFDAGVLHVNPEKLKEDGSVEDPLTVNLNVTDHQGATVAIQNVRIWEGNSDAETPPEDYAYWMPYQIKQAEKAAAEVAQVNDPGTPAPI